MNVALTEGEPRLRRATEDPFDAALFIDGTELRRGAELKVAKEGWSGVAAVGFNCVTRDPGLLAEELEHLAKEIAGAGWQVLATHRGPGVASSTQVVHHFGGHGEVHEERWILVGHSESWSAGPVLAEVVGGHQLTEKAGRRLKFGFDGGGAGVAVRDNVSVGAEVEELCEWAERGAVPEVHDRFHRMVWDLTWSGSTQRGGEVVSLCPQAGFEEVEEAVRLSWERPQRGWRPTLRQWVRRCAQAQPEDLRFQLGARLWGAETAGLEDRWATAESLAEVVAALAG